MRCRNPHCVPMRCQNSSLRPNEMGCSSSHREGVPQPLVASGGNGMPLRASVGTVGAPHCVPMRCRISSLRHNEMECSSSHSKEMSQPPTASRGKGMPLGASERDVGTPHCVPMRRQNSSLRPNEMGLPSSHREGVPQPLVPSGGNGMTLRASVGTIGAPHCVRMRCRNSSLRHNEMECSSSHRRGMSQPPTASGGDGIPSEHRNEMSDPLTASQ
jgi:hypothetical protein